MRLWEQRWTAVLLWTVALSIAMHSGSVVASGKLQSNSRRHSSSSRGSTIFTSKASDYVTQHNNNRIVQLACEQTEKVQANRSKAESDRAVRTIFKLLRSVVGSTNSKNIDKLVQIAKLYKGDNLAFRLKERSSIVSMRNILCGPAAAAAELAFKSLDEKTTVVKQEGSQDSHRQS